MSESKELSILKAKISQTFSCHIKNCEGLTLGTILGTVGILTQLRLGSDRCKLLKTWCRRGESNPHESHPSPDFESGRASSEKLRKANKTLGIRGFLPDQMSDSLSQFEFARWTKRGWMFLAKIAPHSRIHPLGFVLSVVIQTFGL